MFLIIKMLRRLILCNIIRHKGSNRNQLRNSGVCQWKYQKIKNYCNNHGIKYHMLLKSSKLDRLSCAKTKQKNNFMLLHNDFVSTYDAEFKDLSECSDDDDDFIVFTNSPECEFEEESMKNPAELMDVKKNEKKKKKVHFNLVPTIYFWENDYDLVRKGPWEMYALDRKRFEDRINTIGKSLEFIFSKEYRDNIWKNRFTSQN